MTHSNDDTNTDMNADGLIGENNSAENNIEPENTRPSWTDHLIWGGPLIAMFVGWLFWLYGLEKQQAITLGITLATAIWWVFEVLPFGVSSLLPLATFPLYGILTKNQIAESFGNHLVLLLFGGFVLSQALEKSGAHRTNCVNDG